MAPSNHQKGIADRRVRPTKAGNSVEKEFTYAKAKLEHAEGPLSKDAKIGRACLSYLKANPKGPVWKARIYDDEECRVTIYNAARSKYLGGNLPRRRRGFVVSFGYHIGEGADHEHDVWEATSAEGETALKAVANFLIRHWGRAIEPSSVARQLDEAEAKRNGRRQQ